MKTTEKNLIKLLLLISLGMLFSGCVAKRADGTYKSTYSYHPYNRDSLGKKIYHTKQPNRIYRPIYQSNQQRESQSIQRVEKVAISQMGKEYKWGANGPYNFDCSGFTKFVYSKNGINLPRVSSEQAKVGKLITFGNLKKGDLIFFDSSKSSKVSHTGIYLGGREFIHASSSKDRVVISSIDSNYYSKHFKWGRRVIR